MPKRRSTFGTNEDAGRGYRRLRYWADLHDGRGYVRHSKTIRGTRRDGDAELARIRVLHSEDRAAPTVRQAYESWWLPDALARHEAGEMSQNSLTSYRSKWRKHIEPTFGDVPAPDVTALAITEWVSHMTSSMASLSLVVLRQVLDFCVLYGYMDTNPADARIRMPRAKGNVRDKGVYDAAGLCAALDAARGTLAYVPAVLCGVGSCRTGESLGARVEDVGALEVDGRTVAVVWVRRQVGCDGNVMPMLKTAASERPVAIPEPWSADVLAARDASEDGWLCGDGTGSPLSQRVVRAAWKETALPEGLPRIPMGNLRNTWRTVMRWEMGVDEDMCERMMGHAGKSVGEIHYDRPREEYFAAVADAAWARWRDGHPQA